MAIELRGGELVRAMVSASHEVGDENARLSVHNMSPLQATRVTV